MTSPLTTPFAVMLEDLNAQLETAGYSFDKSHVSLRHHLATALSGLRGRSASELTLSLAELLCEIANAADGGSRSPNQSPIGGLLAAGVDALAGGGGGGSYTGPLDLVAGAVVAYSQRALSAANRNSALYTIDNGTTTQSFSSDATTGEAPVSAITAFVGGGTGTIALWNDQSGNGTSALQATKANQPAWKASATNARPSFIFDHTASQALVSSGNAALTGNGQTIFFVAKFTNRVTGNFLGIIKSDGDFSYALVGTSAGHAGGTTDFLMDAFDGSTSNEAGGFTTDITLSDYGVGDYGWTFGSGFAAWNGGNFGNDNSEDATGAPGAFSAPFVIGTAAPLSTQADMEILEVLIYPSVLSDDNRLAIRQNIATYYGITLT